MTSLDQSEARDGWREAEHHCPHCSAPVRPAPRRPQPALNVGKQKNLNIFPHFFSGFDPDFYWTGYFVFQVRKPEDPEPLAASQYPQAVPIPDIPHDSSLTFEVIMFSYVTAALGLQYLNLYR